MDTIREKVFKIDSFDEDGNIKVRVLKHLLFFIYSAYVNTPDNYTFTVKLIVSGGDIQDIDALETILIEYAHNEGLEPEFMDWIERANPLKITRIH